MKYIYEIVLIINVVLAASCKNTTKTASNLKMPERQMNIEVLVSRFSDESLRVIIANRSDSEVLLEVPKRGVGYIVFYESNDGELKSYGGLRTSSHVLSSTAFYLLRSFPLDATSAIPGYDFSFDAPLPADLKEINSFSCLVRAIPLKNGFFEIDADIFDSMLSENSEIIRRSVYEIKDGRK